MANAKRIWWKRRRPMQMFFASFFLVGFFLVLSPFAPLLAYSFFPPNADTIDHAVPFPKNLTPTENRLAIPKIGVDIPVLEGDEKALERGAWRIPQTSDDPGNSNMVVSAHRFRYRPPATTTFYLLDKLTAGDEIHLVWNGTAHRYRVQTVRVVEATTLSVLDPTATPTLTLVTCAPLFSTAQRLIVTALPL